MLSAGQGSNRALSISMCFLVERVGTVCAGGSLKGVGDICVCLFVVVFFPSIFFLLFLLLLLSQVVMGSSCMCKVKSGGWIDTIDSIR